MFFTFSRSISNAQFFFCQIYVCNGTNKLRIFSTKRVSCWISKAQIRSALENIFSEFLFSLPNICLQWHQQKKMFPYLFVAKIQKLRLKHPRLSKISFPLLQRSWNATINSTNFISNPERQKYTQKRWSFFEFPFEKRNSEKSSSRTLLICVLLLLQLTLFGSLSFNC